mgnify:CR=1 FL=1|jgi:hypothetical protein
MASPATTSRPGVMMQVDDGGAAATTTTKANDAQPDADAPAAAANDENKQSIASIFEEGSKNIDTAR